MLLCNSFKVECELVFDLTQKNASTQRFLSKTNRNSYPLKRSAAFLYLDSENLNDFFKFRFDSRFLRNGKII